MPPNLYLIAGANGSGKTTFAREILPQFVHCREFLNADLMAEGLSPFDPETAAIRAGRLLLERIKELTVLKKGGVRFYSGRARLLPSRSFAGEAVFALPGSAGASPSQHSTRLCSCPVGWRGACNGAENQ